MSENNGQNGCKVFASITKFGETKFKPIRKQENFSNIKSIPQSSNKRIKIEENQQPATKSRVNKFFKSRNVGTNVLEETNRPKPVITTNITPIRNEPQQRFKEEKPLKIKIKKDKNKDKINKLEKVNKIEKIEKPIKQPKQIRRIEPDSPPRLKSPNVSNQTRYSTRSRRSNETNENQQTDDSKFDNELNNQKNQFNKQFNLQQQDQQFNLQQQDQQFNLQQQDQQFDSQQFDQLFNSQQQDNQQFHLQQESNQINEQFDQQFNLHQHESDQIDEQFNQQSNLHEQESNRLNEKSVKKTKSTKEKKITIKTTINSDQSNETTTHQYGTRRSKRKIVNDNVNNDNLVDNNLMNYQDNQLSTQPIVNSNIDLDDNNLEDLSCNLEEIKFDKEPNLKNEDFRKFFTDDQDDYYKPSTITAVKTVTKSNENDEIDFQSDNNQFIQSSSQPIISSSQKSDLIDEQQFSFSQPAPQISIEQQQSQQTANQEQQKSNVNALPQKKRFFSRKDKEKKVQYNVKNFFANKDDANDDEDAEKLNSQQEQNKIIEFDSDKLKKVKEAHKCAELGEAEHFDGEIKFYLSGIKEKNTNSMRCLSILGLTGQFLNKPELRMHLRAHDYMGKIISALMDSPKNPNLALCAACLMFVYNQDRLTMDIDPNALSLMLELLETKADQVNQIEEKHRNKIVEMCKIMKTKGHGKYLKLNDISAGTLAMETLLGLTSKRAGDWFKEELRKLNGIDYLLDTILTTSSSEQNEYMQQESELNKIDRSLRVIENVTCQNKENQEYVIDYKDNIFIKRCIKLYELFKDGIIASEVTNNHFLSPLLTILRVFTNLTSDSDAGCSRIGDSIPEIFDIFLNSVFELPSFIIPDSRFDLIIFLLCLCLNLIESCEKLHNNFINNKYQVKRLISMLEERCDEAKKTEQQADDFLDSEETQRMLNAETINIDSILTDLVAKSGKHMEHTIIAACISLLIGSGLKDLKDNNYDQVNSIKQLLPNNSFSMMIDVITKLKEFSNLASIMTKSGIKRVESILAVLKHL